MNIALLSFLAVVAIGIIRLDNLFAVTMLTGIYSLLTAGLFVTLDAVDVAFTEAAVGGGISTVLMLGTLALTGESAKPKKGRWRIALPVVLITGGALIYGTLDMPRFGDPQAPVHTHVVPRYIEESPKETGLPNIVTSILASYRGYDTMGEVTVIFTAGIGVMVLLAAATRRRRRASTEDGDGGP